MMTWREFEALDINKKISVLYEEATFVMSIRYYGYKVNLYLLNGFYFEVFVNHKRALIEKIIPLDMSHTRMKFYSDQIKLPSD